MSKYKKNIWVSFIAGYIFSNGQLMYRQDSMGLLKYLDYLQNNWTTMPTIFSAVLIILSIIAFIGCATADIN